MGDAPAFVILIGMMFPFVNRQSAFYYSVSLSIALFTRCVLKLVFRAPRAYMVNLLVYPSVCDTTYGTPDSEVMLTTFMLLVVWLHKSAEKSERPDKRTNQKIV